MKVSQIRTEYVPVHVFIFHCTVIKNIAPSLPPNLTRSIFRVFRIEVNVCREMRQESTVRAAARMAAG